MPDAGFGVVALFLPQHAYGGAPETSEAADDGFILGEFAVARQRGEIGDQAGAVIDEMRPLRMARHKGLLPRRELAVEIPQRLRGLCLKARDVVGNRDGVPVFTEGAKLFDLGFKFGDGLFEIEVAAHQTL